MKHRLCLLALVFSLGIAGPHAAERVSIEIIDLQYRTAEEVVPLIESLLGPGEVVTGEGMRLILRSAPATLAEVRQILHSLDAAPTNLLISVRRGAHTGSLEREVQVQGRSDGVIIGDGSQTRIIRRTTTERDGSIQTLRVLEGQVALIRTGESVPRVSSGPILLQGGVLVGPGIDYRDVERGFVVRPRLGGHDRVHLYIRQFHEREAVSGGGRIELQEVDTVLSGALGEWIRIAGSAQRQDVSEQRILGMRRDRQDGELDIYLRVDRVE